MLHSNMGLEYAHVPYAFEYETEGQRVTATGFTSEDLGKFARQLSDNSIWMLVSTAPVWVAVGGSGGGGGQTPVNKLTSNLNVATDTSYIVLSYFDTNGFDLTINGNMGILG